MINPNSYFAPRFRQNRKPALYCILYLLFIILAPKNLISQAPFTLELEAHEIPGVGGIHSYAYAQHQGKWIIIGGRLDGLHQRQPFASFDLAGHNNRLIVIDPETQTQWSAGLSDFPAMVQEQFRSTNMEFYQDQGFLYVVGGYGYSDFHGDHVTFQNLTAIDVAGLINAVIEGNNLSSFVRQYTHDMFAVTGGYLEKIYDTYQLVGGQKFTGRYNPMGPDHGPGFIQEYTNEIRRFNLNDDGTTLLIDILPSLRDTNQLHRRDFNVLPQILPNGQHGLTAFSGVFQKIADVPYLNSVNIDSAGYEVNNQFQQHYNHYHCASLPLYSDDAGEMHTVFFGGIAQYYEEDGLLIQDDEVPFVKTIARVTRMSDGSMAEYRMPIEMPDYLGASAEFIPIESLPYFPNGVLKLDELPSDRTLIGYIYGGIQSSAKNIFWQNDGSQSIASPTIYKVFLSKEQSAAVDILNNQSQSNLQMQLYPIPNDGNLFLDFNISYKSDVEWTIYDLSGALIARQMFSKSDVQIGQNHRKITLPYVSYGSTMLVELKTKKDRITQKLIIND